MPFFGLRHLFPIRKEFCCAHLGRKTRSEAERQVDQDQHVTPLPARARLRKIRRGCGWNFAKTCRVNGS